MKLKYRILSLLLVLVMLLGTLAGCASTYKPLNYLKKALENTLQKRFGGETVETVLEALSGGSLSLSFGGTDLVETPLEAADLTLWMDSSEQFLTAIGSATAGGKKYDGKLFLDSEQAVVSSAALFGSTDLGVDFDTLEKDLKNSIFRNNSGTEYAVTWMGENAARDLTIIKDGVFSIYRSLETWLELSDEVVEIFLEILVKHAAYQRYSKEGRIHVAVTVDNDSLSRTLRDTRVAMVEDKALCREMRAAAKTADAISSAKSGSVITAKTDAVESFIASSAGVDTLCDTIDAMPDFELQLGGVVRRSNDVIETLDLSFSVMNMPLLSFAMDLTEKETNVLSLTVGAVSRKLTYTVTKDSLRHYHAEMAYEKTVLGVPAAQVTGTLQANRREDHFELKLQNGIDERCFTGSFDKKIDGFEVAFEQVTVNGEQRKLALSLAVDVDAKAPAAPEKYESIATITVPRFEPVAATFKAACEELIAAWGDADASPQALAEQILAILGIDETFTE